MKGIYNMEKFNTICGIIYLAIIHLLAVIGIVCLTTRHNKQTTLPVEDIHHIDSLVSVNDSIKIVVEHLDSAKNAKVIEVSMLDNDSTVKLFYELLSK